MQPTVYQGKLGSTSTKELHFITGYITNFWCRSMAQMKIRCAAEIFPLQEYLQPGNHKKIYRTNTLLLNTLYTVIYIGFKGPACKLQYCFIVAERITLHVSLGHARKATCHGWARKPLHRVMNLVEFTRLCSFIHITGDEGQRELITTSPLVTSLSFLTLPQNVQNSEKRHASIVLWQHTHSLRLLYYKLMAYRMQHAEQPFKNTFFSSSQQPRGHSDQPVSPVTVLRHCTFNTVNCNTVCAIK